MKNKVVFVVLVLLPCLFDMGMPSFISYCLIICIGLLCSSGFKFPNKPFVNAIMLIVLSALFRFNQYSGYLFKDIGLMIIGVFPLLMKDKFKINIINFNVCIVIAFILVAGVSLFKVSFSLEAFLHSDTGIELGTFAYLFAFLAIYWTNRSNKWVIINMVCSVLCGKRIATLSIVFCVLAAYLLRGKDGYASKKLKLLMFGGCTAYLFISYLFVSGYFDDIIFQFTGLSPDAFTMGRQVLYSAVFEKIPDPNLWGLGPGNTIDIINYAQSSDTRMHNDFLKIYSENGIFMYCAFFYFLLKRLTISQIPTLLMIFAIFMTTNSLVYSVHLFFYCIFLYHKDFIRYTHNKKAII